jgi:5'-methylthioadenosine phosphorylase
MPGNAIIGGSGFYKMGCAKFLEKREIITDYGNVTIFTYDSEGSRFMFLPRHGESHSCPPHKVNYRANIMALKQIGIENIIGVASTGSLKKKIKPGSFVVLDQFLDFTKARPSTFFDGEDGKVVHTDVTEPYCPKIRECLVSEKPKKPEIHKKGTYVCAEGPRFETAAEIKMFAKLGGDVVGMTNVPECVLARELGMCYAGLAVVTNYAAGISDTPISHEEVLAEMQAIEPLLHEYVVNALLKIPEKSYCNCKKAAGYID